MSSTPPFSLPTPEVRAELERALLVALRRDADALDELKLRMDRSEPDGVYRLFHQSFKVYHLQERTEEIVEALQALLPDVPLHPWFLAIVRDGTGRVFGPGGDWLSDTRPIVEAFLIAKQVLDMACRYSRAFEEPPSLFEPGWGLVLYLFLLR